MVAMQDTIPPAIQETSSTYTQKTGNTAIQSASLPAACICDIDGTLALRGERDIFDFARAGEDAICVPVRSVVYLAHDAGMQIIVCTGREDKYREVTEDWLRHWGVPYDQLLMRTTDDTRGDDVVKRELFEHHIAGRYDVQWVLDDRKRVKRRWVELGFFVFDCNQHDLEF